MSDDQEPGTSPWSLPRPLSQCWATGDETPSGWNRAAGEEQSELQPCPGAGAGEVGKESSGVAALEGEGGQRKRGQAGMEQKASGRGDGDAADLFRLGLAQLRVQAGLMTHPQPSRASPAPVTLCALVAREPQRAGGSHGVTGHHTLTQAAVTAHEAEGRGRWPGQQADKGSQCARPAVLGQPHGELVARPEAAL